MSRQSRYYHHAIEKFGPDRCMFEGNFPIDKCSLSYPVLWNAFKRIAAEHTEAEKDAMFRGTATRVYGLEPLPIWDSQQTLDLTATTEEPRGYMR